MCKHCEGSNVQFLQRLLAAKNPSHAVLISAEMSLDKLTRLILKSSEIPEDEAEEKLTRLDGIVDKMETALTEMGVTELGEAILITAAMTELFVKQCEREAGYEEAEEAAVVMESKSKLDQQSAHHPHQKFSGSPMKGMEKGH
jgi:hypothetical protein